jgi:phage tail tube protein FII
VSTGTNGLTTALTVDSGLTVATRKGHQHSAHGGAGAVTLDVGLDIDVLTGATSVGVRSAITANANRFFLQDTGGAQSSFVGKFTKYNNVTTDGVGMPAVVKVIDLQTQSAATAGTALFTPSAAGLYRISVAVTLTRAGTTSVLAGAGGVKINYTSGDGATAKNQDVPFWIPGSTTATVVNSATNTVGDTLIGAIVIYSSTTAVTYDVGYTSTGVTSMQYALRIRVEAL